MLLDNPRQTSSTAAILCYSLLAYGVIGLLALVFHLAGGTIGSAAYTLVAAAAMFAPLVASVLTHRFVLRSPWRPSLGVPLKEIRWIWLLPAAIVPVLLCTATLVGALLLPDVTWSPGLDGLLDRMAPAMSPEQLEEARAALADLPFPAWMLLPISMLQAALMGSTVNAVFAFGEEAGWRGFLEDQWGALGFWRSSLLTGVLWGFWHFPLILLGHNYPDHRVAGVFLFVIITVGLSPWHTLFRRRSGSVLGAAVFHGSFNSAGGISLLFLAGGTGLTVGITGVAGMVVLALSNLLLWGVLQARPGWKER